MFRFAYYRHRVVLRLGVRRRSLARLACGGRIASGRGPHRAALNATRRLQGRLGNLAVVLLALICGAVSLEAQTSPPAAGQADPSKSKKQPSNAAGTDKGATKARQRFPKLNEMVLPTAKELLQDPPVDWLVLVNEDVIVTEPVYPRPDTIAKMKQRIEESLKWPRPKTENETTELRARREELRYFHLHLPEFADEPEYRLELRHVQQIIYHEDLMLRRVDTLLDERNLDAAFEMLLVLDRSQPNWPGFDDRQNRLLFLEAESMVGKNDVERALVYLEDLHGRNPEYPKLSPAMGSVCDRLIHEAYDAGDFRRARHFLGRLSAPFPDHAVVKQWSDRLLAMSTDLLSQAEAASAQGRHDQAALLADRAARVWPAAPDLREAHRRYANRFQRLNVGVLRLAGEPSPYPFPADADLRHQMLTQFTLFEVDRTDPEAAHYRSRFFEEWEPTDLGRQSDFRLKVNRAYWESRRIVTASEVITALAARLDPARLEYDERLAGYVDSIDVTSPFEFRMRFSRVPLRLEGLLDFPLEFARESAAGPFSRFVVQERVENKATYRRSVPQQDRLSEYHVAEVNEIKYPSHNAAVQGLLRGEVSLLPKVQSWDVAPLAADDRFFVQKYALPVTHVLQFHPESRALKSDELRRAMIYGLDRRRILNDVILRGASSDLARIATGPFATNSYAHNPLITPREYDPTLAISLVIAARKQLGGQIPTLRMVCDPDPIVTEAARAIVADWKQLGLNVDIVEQAASHPGGPLQSGSPPWDIVYRKLRIVEPLLEAWPLLTFDERARVESLSPMPQWLRQQIIALDGVGDWSTAVAALYRLHRDLWSEVQMIPLWEVDDFIVIRKTIRGFNPTPMHPYQGVESWVCQPWYPLDAP